MEEQPQPGSTRLGAQAAFVDDYLQKMHKLLDRETPEVSRNIAIIKTSAVLAIKQDPQGLIMPTQAAIEKQQEVSVVVHRSLEASVYCSMKSEENQLHGVRLQQCPLSTLVPVSSSKPPQILGTSCCDVPDTSYFLFTKVQLISSNLSLLEFYCSLIVSINVR